MKLLLLLASATLFVAGCDEAGNAQGRATAQRPPAAAGKGVDWTTRVAATPEGGFRMGNSNARVKLVEYASMTCGVCRSFSEQSKAALGNYVRGGQVSFEIRNFIRDSYDVVAAKLARCGGARTFFPLTEAMFREQSAFVTRGESIPPAEAQAIGALPPAQQFVRLGSATGLDRFVGQRGITAAKARACLADKAELDRLLAMTQAANRDHKVTGTPTFLINDRPVGNTVSWAQLEPQLRAALER